MKLTITGNNVVSNGKQLHGIVINKHVLLPSNEDFIIFDNEEQKKLVLQVINQYSNIKLKYNNALLRSEANDINDDTTFIINGNSYNLYGAAILIKNATNNINNEYTIDLRFLKFFKNINSLYISVSSNARIIIDCTNITTISQLHQSVLLLNTNNIKYINNCTGSIILNKIISFPSLETLDVYSFASATLDKLVNLGIITHIPTQCFSGARINQLILPQTCHTIMGNAFTGAKINRLVSDYVTTLKANAIFSCDIKTLSFPNLQLFDKDEQKEENIGCITNCNSLEEIKSLGKITILPKYAITNLPKLIYLDIPLTLRELHNQCLSYLGSYNFRIQNTLDFSHITNIDIVAISNIYANIIIFPTSFTGEAVYGPILYGLNAKKIVNINCCYGITPNPNTEIVLTNLNNYDDVPDSSLNFQGSIVTTQSNTLQFSHYYNGETTTINYTVPVYKHCISSLSGCGKLTVNTPYINAIKDITVYKEIVLSDNIEYIYNITFLGEHFDFPANLKYIGNCTFRNLKTISYPSNLLVKAAYNGIFQGNINGVIEKPINFIFPCELYATNAISTGMFIEEEIIRLPEGIKQTYSGGLNIFSQTCKELVLPSTMTYLTQGTLYLPQLETLTILSESFTLDNFSSNNPIQHLNIDNCKFLNINPSALRLNMEIIEFPATLEKLGGMPGLNSYSCLKKIIFHGTTELEAQGLIFSGNPTTVKEIINIHLAFINDSSSSSYAMINLEKITFADDLPNSTILGSNLSNKKKLREVRLPNTLVTISANALSGTNISEIDIPESVEFISNTAFKRCSNLRSMIVRATTPPTSEEGDKKRVSNLCTIYVPAESLQLYQESPYWRAHFNQIEAIEGEELEAANQVYYTIKRNNITL